VFSSFVLIEPPTEGAAGEKKAAAQPKVPGSAEDLNPAFID